MSEALPDAARCARRRGLRLALGVAACVAFSQAMAWPLSYVAPILTAMLLAQPTPPPRPQQAVLLALLIVVPLLLGTWLLLPLLWYARWAGVALLGLLLFYTFLLGARGVPPLIVTCLTLGLTVTVTVGSVSPALLGALVPALLLGVACGVVFAWIAHAALPDPWPPVAAPTSTPPGPAADTGAAPSRAALRSLLVVFPLALLFLFSSASPAFTPVMIKTAALGQEAGTAASRRLGLSLMASTFWGGVAAVACWQLLSLWPSLLLFTLLVALVCLLAAPHIFLGTGPHPRAPMVSYALVTFVILIAPSLADTPFSSAAGAAFWTRLLLFVGVAVYGTLAVAAVGCLARVAGRAEHTVPPARSR